MTTIAQRQAALKGQFLWLKPEYRHFAIAHAVRPDVPIGVASMQCHTLFNTAFGRWDGEGAWQCSNSITQVSVESLERYYEPVTDEAVLDDMREAIVCHGDWLRGRSGHWGRDCRAACQVA